MTDLARYPDAIKPVWGNGGESDGMGPALFLVGPQWKAWNGRLLVGNMASEDLKVLELKSDGSFANVMTADLPKARMRSLVQDAEGNLYVATDGGAIWKIR